MATGGDDTTIRSLWQPLHYLERTCNHAMASGNCSHAQKDSATHASASLVQAGPFRRPTAGRPGRIRPPSPRRSPATPTSGVAGMSIWLMPNSDSASTRAFITAGSDPAQPASPQPLAPSGLVVQGEGMALEAEIRHVGGPRQAVVLVAAGQQLAFLGIGDPLVQRLADALDDAAMRLARDHQRVDDDAEVVDRHVAHHLGMAGLRLDLHLADVAAVRDRPAAPRRTRAGRRGWWAGPAAGCWRCGCARPGP